MADDSSQKIQAIEKDLAVLEHRVTALEGTPPRVTTLEKSVQQLEVQFETMTSDIGEIKNEGKESHRLLVKLGEDVRKLFFIGAVIAGLGGMIVTGLTIYDRWQSIQSHSEPKDGKQP